MLPKMVTFTGLDARTDPDHLLDLSKRYPVEFGILFQDSKISNRYPSIEIVDIILKLQEYSENQGNKIRLAAHLCGGYAQQVRNQNYGDLLRNYIKFPQFARIQVNAISYNDTSLSVLQAHTGCFVVKQHRTLTFPDTPLCVFNLFDKSGGKGKIATSLPQYDGDRLVGFAGGITPENVTDFIVNIKAPNYWIDMESGVRTNDWFDLDKCEAVCKAIWDEI